MRVNDTPICTVSISRFYSQHNPSIPSHSRCKVSAIPTTSRTLCHSPYQILLFFTKCHFNDTTVFLFTLHCSIVGFKGGVFGQDMNDVFFSIIGSMDVLLLFQLFTIGNGWVICCTSFWWRNQLKGYRLVICVTF